MYIHVVTCPAASIRSVWGSLHIDYLAWGNPTLDSQPLGSSALGGSVVYASIQAARMGLRSAIFGRADPVVLSQYWQSYAAEVEIHIEPSPSITTFRNVRLGDRREQWITSWAGQINGSELPNSQIIHIAPVAQEIVLTESILRRCKSRLVCFTPQGMLRKWREPDGYVSTVHRHFSKAISSTVDIVVVSEFEAKYVYELLTAVAERGGLSVITLGGGGCEILTRRCRTTFPPITAHNIVDTTGAGDCFAAALTVAIYWGRPLVNALRTAAAAASLSITGLAVSRIATSEEIEERLVAYGHR